jgi:hypothetical protein
MQGCSFISGHQRTLASPPTRRPGGQPEVRWLQRVRGTPVGTQWGVVVSTCMRRGAMAPARARANLGPISVQYRGDLVRVLGEHLVLGAISGQSGSDLVSTWFSGQSRERLSIAAAANSCARSESAERLATSAGSAPSRAIMSWLSGVDERCQSARVAFSRGPRALAHSTCGEAGAASW